MTMNENTTSGKWLEIKGNIQKIWGKITDNELEQTKGDLKSISGLIQQRYGEAQESYGKRLSEIMKDFKMKKDETVDAMKDSIKS